MSINGLKLSESFDMSKPISSQQTTRKVEKFADLDVNGHRLTNVVRITQPGELLLDVYCETHKQYYSDFNGKLSGSESLYQAFK